ncbi:MAG: PDZ domain-containing protein [Thermoleophilia bacterium]|nr:PDZ domain-containing protein [Thermoleophilia bacterium]
MRRNNNRLAAAVAVAALAGGGAGATAVTLTHGSSHDAEQAAVATPSVSNVASSALSVGQIAKADTPSVVEIDATEAAPDSPFPGGSQSSKALGTGFVYDAKGDIVTNQHVVSGSTSVTVKFSDGSTYKGTVVGTDPSTDLAVVRVNAPASKLVPLSLADSSQVAVGDGVVAIGNPFGLDGTVTSGIVSALNREITAPDDSPIEGAIQTDAAINHGNSGGPLLDLHGNVIGVTSQIQSDSGGNDGVGFAIPSNTVRSIVSQLVATGKAQHALLGVQVRTAGSGVGVSQVSSGSAADSAGLQAGDVITAVDGTTVASAEKLRALIAGHKPGDRITLTILRSGSTKSLTATLGSK